MKTKLIEPSKIGLNLTPNTKTHNYSFLVIMRKDLGDIAVCKK